jgi:hypothetical protein
MLKQTWMQIYCSEAVVASFEELEIKKLAQMKVE